MNILSILKTPTITIDPQPNATALAAILRQLATVQDQLQAIGRDDTRDAQTVNAHQNEVNALAALRLTRLDHLADKHLGATNQVDIDTADRAIARAIAKVADLTEPAEIAIRARVKHNGRREALGREQAALVEQLPPLQRAALIEKAAALAPALQQAHIHYFNVWANLWGYCVAADQLQINGVAPLYSNQCVKNLTLPLPMIDAIKAISFEREDLFQAVKLFANESMSEIARVK